MTRTTLESLRSDTLLPMIAQHPYHILSTSAVNDHGVHRVGEEIQQDISM